MSDLSFSQRLRRAVKHVMVQGSKEEDLKKLAAMTGITDQEQQELFELALKSNANEHDGDKFRTLTAKYKARGAYFTYDAEGNPVNR